MHPSLTVGEQHDVLGRALAPTLRLSMVLDRLEVFDACGGPLVIEQCLGRK